MSKPTPNDSLELFGDDQDLGITHQEYERARGRKAVRQGIDDYFERKQLSEIDDWFGAME